MPFNDWLIAFWHSPPYTFGSHNSDSAFDTGGHLVQMRQNAVPILEAHGVDLVLCGHSHGGGYCRVLPNVDVFTGGAEYGQPRLQGVFEVD